MPGAHWLASLLVLGSLTSGCADDPDPAASRAPVPGGPSLAAATPPATPMDDVERPVAHRLAPGLRDDGLDLEYVECPAWSGTLPSTLHCRAYVDGVVGAVTVELSRGHGGDPVFDAWLDHGLVATESLVDRLEARGYLEVDCGQVPAYPARTGTRIVCEVHGDPATSHVVATVTDSLGHVRIEDY